MDGVFSNGGFPRSEAAGDETGASGQRKSGHEIRNDLADRAPENSQAGTAGSREEPMTRHADAEELLSRARAHAEVLRAHAEASRAEAVSLRAEAAAVRNAARDGLADAIFRAETLAAEIHAAAAELRAVMEGQADQARAEIELARAEADSLRRLLQADRGTALADTQRLRGEVEGLRSEINQLAAELHVLPRDRGGDTGPADFAGGPTRWANLDELRTIALEIEREFADADAYGESADRPAPEGATRSSAAFNPGDGTSPPAPDRDSTAVIPVADAPERFRGSWDAAYPQATADPFFDRPAGAGPAVPRPPEPLIGSGGWRPTHGLTPRLEPADSGVERAATVPPPDAGPHRRRFGRHG